MKKHNTKGHSAGKNIIVTMLCVTGAAVATFIGVFSFLGSKAKQHRNNCKKERNPLEQESIRDEF